MKIVATSGYFDPLHVGHLECLEKASKLGDKLIVIVNSDLQAKLKKGESFMKEEDRMKIVSTLDCVDEVFLSIDTDKSQCESLKYLKPDIFAKGGDRMSDEIPESKICKEIGIKIIDGLGKKIRSSSDLTGLKETNMKFLTRKLVTHEDLNPRGYLHGGQLLKWIDEEGGIHAGLELKFPVILGDVIEIGMKTLKIGSTSVTLSCEVRSLHADRPVLTIDKIVYVRVNKYGLPKGHGWMSKGD